MNNYFSHDSNARDDEKILAMRIDLGWEAYGLYWALIEMLRDASDYMLNANYKVLAFSLHTTVDLIEQIICSYGLFSFTEDGKSFFSHSLTKRMEEKEVVSKKRRASAGTRWGRTSTSDANAEQDGCKCNANAEQDGCKCNANAEQSKVNESKVKENKEDYSSPRTRVCASAPSEEEKREFYRIFFWRNVKNPGIVCEQFIQHNEQYGWRMNDTPEKRREAAYKWTPEVKGDRVSKTFLAAWKTLYDRIKDSHPTLANCMLNSDIRLSANNGYLVIHVTKELQDYMRENNPPELLALANGNPIRYAWP